MVQTAGLRGLAGGLCRLCILISETAEEDGVPVRLRPDDVLALLLVAVTIVSVVLMVNQSSWPEALGASGFLLVTLGWLGMHLRLRIEAPDHPLARASYVLGSKRS